MKKQLQFVTIFLFTILISPFVLKAQNPVIGSVLNISNDSTNTIGITSSGGVMGKNNTVSSTLSFIFGEKNKTGNYATGSFVFGGNDTVILSQSVCFGFHNTVSSMGGLAIGRYLNAGGSSNTFVIGEGINASRKLVSESDHCLYIGFNSTKPTLKVTVSPNNVSQGIYDKTGRIAIGNVTPQAKLHIRSDTDEDAGIILVPADTANSDAFIKLWDENHYIEVNSKGTMDIRSHQSPMRLVGSTLTLDGKVGVNTTNDIDGYALAVDGGVITTKVYIQDVEDWHDEVFGEGYRLMPTDELKGYLCEHHHLPGVPSEAEVKANGYDIATMHGVLLEKIEELTLYMLRQQEELDSLRTMATVHFGYDACGNRVSRTLEFARINDERNLASLRDRFAENDALLFPNPTEGGFMLSLTGTDIPQNATATLCTIDGKVVEARAVSNTTEEFDLTGRPSGIYLLRLASERETKVWKVIKRR
ncbi:MAG: T9SS type A sorting domain-containing protein [Prevotella sp.]|jgi:hypothetical protein|nr:T9SS type A sorting domain-containing protein [Prevotella sp.]